MSKKLVAYFSASGVTAKVAETLAEAIGADIFEIEPKVPYTEVDLNWMYKKARSTIEMNDPASRPEIAVKRDNMKDYDTIFVGLTATLSAPVLPLPKANDCVTPSTGRLKQVPPPIYVPSLSRPSVRLAGCLCPNSTL